MVQPKKSPPKKKDLFGYESPPQSPVLGREVLKFLQSLDLTHSVKDPRRDLANGFIVAQVLSRFYPADIQMHSVENGHSEYCKRSNWQMIQKGCRKNNMELPAVLVEGAIKGERGAANALIEHLFEVLTGKRLQRMVPLDQVPGMEPNRTPVPLPFGEPAAAAADASALKAIQAQPTANKGLAFGMVQTAMVSDAAALRKKFAAEHAAGSL